MGEVIKTYMASLMSDYHPGSRKWLYEDADEWLDGNFKKRGLGVGSALPRMKDALSRMYLLLAGSGMGKTIFAAKMHTQLAVLTNVRLGLIMVRDLTLNS